MGKTYAVPISEIRREHKVQNSQFIATLAPAFSIAEARSFMARIKQEFSNASHNVPIYLIGGGNTVTEYFSDDGEPAGTSGKPALAVLRGSGLGDSVLVITRYFGGTLLGTGGLVKAYAESAQLVVSSVARGTRTAVHVATVALPYTLLERLRLAVSRQGGAVLGEEFGADVIMTLRFPVDLFDSFLSDLQEISAGKLRASILETKDIVLPI